MTTISGAACGASAYTRADRPATGTAANGFATVSPGDASWQAWGQRIDDLLAARNLTDDWDGQGAVAPHPAVVDGAITLAQHLLMDGVKAPDFAIPGANGTILFEWHGPVEYVEIEVIAPDVAERRAVNRETGETQVRRWLRRG